MDPEVLKLIQDTRKVHGIQLAEWEATEIIRSRKFGSDHEVKSYVEVDAQGSVKSIRRGNASLNTPTMIPVEDRDVINQVLRNPQQFQYKGTTYKIKDGKKVKEADLQEKPKVRLSISQNVIDADGKDTAHVMVIPINDAAREIESFEIQVNGNPRTLVAKRVLRIRTEDPGSFVITVTDPRVYCINPRRVIRAIEPIEKPPGPTNPPGPPE